VKLLIFGGGFFILLAERGVVDGSSKDEVKSIINTFIKFKSHAAAYSRSSLDSPKHFVFREGAPSQMTFTMIRSMSFSISGPGFATYRCAN
jgi:hypothetical protein